MSENVLLVKLNAEQIKLAKHENGERTQISHAVVCGKYGQLFGTEKQCRKYYEVWKRIFPIYLQVGLKLMISILPTMNRHSTLWS